MRLRTLAATLLAATAMGGVLVPALPARATGTTVVPATVPTGERWQPRRATLGGVGDAGFVYTLETDPRVVTSPQDPGTQTRWHGFDGSDVALDRSATVVGDRLVQPIGYPVTSVGWRGVSDAGWSTLVLPGAYLGATADGVLVDYAPSDWTSGVLELLPWDGSAPIAVSGLDGFHPNPYSSCCAFRVDAHGGVIAGLNGFAYVDTRVAQGWPLPTPPSGSQYSLGPDTIAWGDYTVAGDKVISTIARPAPGQPLGTVTSRPYPQGVSTGFANLLPLGVDVLVWVGSSYRQEASPVLAVATDGTATTVLAWGHDVESDGAGGAYVVAGNTPDTSAIVHLSAGSYAASSVVTVLPYPAQVHAVALDGGRLLTIDDSDAPFADTGDDTLVQREVTGAPDAVSVSAPTELTTGVSWGCSPGEPQAQARCSALAADGGRTVYERYDSQSGEATVVLRDADSTEHDLAPASGTGLNDVRELDSGRWLTGVTYYDDVVYDTSTDQIVSQNSLNYGLFGTVSRGVVYRPYQVDPGSISMRDLATGATAAFPLAGCTGIDDIEVTGSWALSGCSVAVGRVAVHLTDGSQWALGDGSFWLGDGFVVRLAADGTLNWSDLADPNHAWQPLGTATTNSFGETATSHWGAVAVSRTGTATVAWVDPVGVAHVAVLPVTSTGTPPPVTGPSTPPSPVTGLATSPRDGKVTVTWSPSLAADSVRHYVVTGPDDVRHVLGASATSYTVTGLTDGTPATIAVAAINTAGESTPATITATPLHDAPPAVANLHISIDQATSTAQVSWDYQDDASHQPARGFVVSPATLFGYPNELPATTRSLSFQVPTKNLISSISVSSVSDDGSTTSTDGVNYTFPGVDTTAPRLWLEPVPPDAVTTSRSAFFAFDGPDDDDPAAAITYTCSLDGASPTQCQNGVNYNGLADGPHAFVVTATDPAGNAATQSHTWTVDATAPTIKSVSPAHVFTTSTGITPRWSANGTSTAVTAYNISWQLAGPGARMGNWTYPADWSRRLSLTGFRPTISRGTTACLQAKAYDAAGNVSAWSTPICETRLLDDRSLARATPGWRRITRNGAYLNTVTTTTTEGARLTRTSVVARRLAILATKCPSCGRVGVYIGHTRVGTINLAATTTHRYALTTLTLIRTYTGRLTLLTLSAKQLVTIDGFAASPV